MDENNQSFERIKDTQRRNKYLLNQIRMGLSFQMRALRQARQLTQSGLAELLHTKQTVISRIENHKADKLSIPTLLKMAEVFDVGLVVRFESIDAIVDWYDNLTPNKLAPQKSEVILEEMEKKSTSSKTLEAKMYKLESGFYKSTMVGIPDTTPEPLHFSNTPSFQIPNSGNQFSAEARVKQLLKDYEPSALKASGMEFK